MFLRARIDVDLAIKKIDTTLKLPDLDNCQRYWLEGMLKFANWYAGLYRPTIKDVDDVRVAVAREFYRYRAYRDFRGIYGGQLVFAAWLRFDNSNPPDTPPGDALQMLMEGKQLRSSVPLVGEK